MSDQVGASGGGGAYATDGGVGKAFPPLLPGVPPPVLPVDTPGGSSASLGITPAVMLLSPEAGDLRGGSGGGGAGGALQAQAGRRAQVDGVLNVSSGAGGRSNGIAVAGQGLPERSAAPGGAGSGGALLMQARELVLAAAAGRIDVRGGAGGKGVGTSVGGVGGTGLVRWVRHPALLNTLFDFLGPQQADALRPNTIRFQVVFDPSAGFVPDFFVGVTNLRILTRPK